MAKCRHCDQQIDMNDEVHHCPEKGDLSISETAGFLVDVGISLSTGSGFLGDIAGGVVEGVLEILGSIFD